MGSPSHLSPVLAAVLRPIHLGTVDGYARCCIRTHPIQSAHKKRAGPPRTPWGSQLQATQALSKLTRERNRERGYTFVPCSRLRDVLWYRLRSGSTRPRRTAIVAAWVRFSAPSYEGSGSKAVSPAPLFTHCRGRKNHVLGSSHQVSVNGIMLPWKGLTRFS